jgi:sec-independent protein translocase protein TatA
MMPLAFGIPGGYEVLIIGFVALLIFGNRLPGVMRSLGQGLTEFKKGINGVEDDPKQA